MKTFAIMNGEYNFSQTPVTAESECATLQSSSVTEKFIISPLPTSFRTALVSRKHSTYMKCEANSTIKSQLEHNKLLLTHDPHKRASLLSLPEHFRRRFPPSAAPEQRQCLLPSTTSQQGLHIKLFSVSTRCQAFKCP